jgi:hypothetical protein
MTAAEISKLANFAAGAMLTEPDRIDRLVELMGVMGAELAAAVYAIAALAKNRRAVASVKWAVEMQADYRQAKARGR